MSKKKSRNKSDKMNRGTDREIIGRTLADLFMENKEDIRCIIILFIIIPLIILAPQLSTLGFEKYLVSSLRIALILTLAWGVLSGIVKITSSSE